MAGWNLRTGILTALVLAAGLVAWALFQPGADPTWPLPEDDGPPVAEAPPEAEDAADPGSSDGPASGSPAPEGAAAGVPRLLPADAALEDLRDALALEGDARNAALREAWSATGRIAAARRKVLVELHALIEEEEDAGLRAVATSALGTERSDENVRWLQIRLASAPSPEERVGALLALARPDDTQGRQSVGTVPAPSLAGLGLPFAPLPKGASMSTALGKFLDAADATKADEILPVLLTSVRASRAHAEALVTDGGELRRFVASLPRADQVKLRLTALTHADLPESVRRALHKIE